MRFLLITIIFAFVTTITATETKVAQWSFKNGSASDDTGKIVFSTVGKTTIATDEKGNSYLNMPAGTFNGAEGIRTTAPVQKLSPTGSFRLVTKLKLDPDAPSNPKKNVMILWDSKFYLWAKSAESDYGFCIALEYVKARNMWCPVAYLGFGSSSAKINGRPVKLDDGAYHQFEFIYDIQGSASFKFDGKTISTAKTMLGGIARSKRIVSIGERNYSSFLGFEGQIAYVALYKKNVSLTTISCTSTGRKVFERLEVSPQVTLTIKNNGTETLPAGSGSLELAGRKYNFNTPVVKTLTPKNINLDISSRLMPGKYPVDVFMEVGGKQIKTTFEVMIVAERGDYMPVFMWETGNQEKIADIGFTRYLHALSFQYFYAGSEEKALKDTLKIMDNALSNRLELCDFICAMRYPGLPKKYPRLNRQGETWPNNIEASNPEMRQTVIDWVERSIGTYGQHPALAMLLINSEVRDHSNPSFNKYESTAFKTFSGFDIPSEVVNRDCPKAESLPDFPANKVISEDYPLYVFYKWWWKQGDGWNDLHSLISKKAKQSIAPKELTTYYDPAARVPPLWGSGGEVDVIGQWTYTYWDPIKIAGATDELRAMAAGRPGQKLLSMTQAICYRSGIAPVDAKVDTPPAWVEKYPDAFYISIPPDHLREAFWSKISRRLDAIAYHGYGSLIEERDVSWNRYRFTNAQGKEVLRKLIADVIVPLGPVLKKVPERTPEVVIMPSFTSTLFAPGHSASWGWGWSPDAIFHTILQWAGFDPAYIFEDQVLRDKLAGVQVLLLSTCSVLTESIINEINRFQENGGIVIGDPMLNPEIMADITIENHKGNKKKAKQDKAKKLENAAKLKKELGKLYTPYSSSSDLEIVTHVRSTGKVDYLFAINDKRDYGDYVGMYKLVMEKGMPNKGVVTVNRTDTHMVCNPVTNKEVPFEIKNGKTVIPVNYSTCDGRLFVLLPEKIDSVSVKTQKSASLNDSFDITVSVNNAAGKPVQAILPVEITVSDTAGNNIPGLDYAATDKDGTLTVKVIPSLNNIPGQWKVSVRELCSNKNAQTNIQVK